MKYSFYLVLISCFTLLTCSSKENINSSPENLIIDDIRLKYAPDKRVAIFDIHLENGILHGETNLPTAKEALIKTINSENHYTDSIRVLQPEFGLVSVSVCNIRSNPAHSAELATQALMGMILRIYKKSGGWYFVQTPDDYLGWLDGGAFNKLSPEQYRDWINASKLVATKAFDFVYATDNSEVVSDIVEGNIMIGIKNEGGKYLVQLPDGRMGKVDAEGLTPYQDFIKAEPNLLDQILSSAHQFMGRPYLWGGTSGKGVDCSGFTKTIFYLNGLELPRDASQQVHVGTEVPTDSSLINLLPGDFIFFGRRGTENEKEKITHVAIYLGDGKIIHSSDRVQIQSLKRGDPDFTEYRLNTLVRARRMLSNVGENGVVKLSDHRYYN